MLDVAIIGSGPAGLSCAIKLALEGQQVDVYERRAKLDDKVCGDGLSVECIKVLSELNITTDNLISIGAKPIKRKFELYDYGQFEKIYPLTCLGLPRIKLDNYLYKLATNLGVRFHFSYNVNNLNKTENGYIINGEIKTKYLVLACGIASSLVKEIKEDIPLGISSRVVGTSERLHSDAFYFKYAPKYGSGYAWVFPVGDNLWNIGVFNGDKKEEIKQTYKEFEEILFKEFIKFERYDRIPGGAFIGASLQDVDIDENAIGDAGYKAIYSSGEGVTFAIKSGIEKAKQILSIKGMK